MQLTKFNHIPLVSVQDSAYAEEGSQFLIHLANLREIDWEWFDIPHRHDGYTIDILLKGSRYPVHRLRETYHQRPGHHYAGA